MTVATAAVEVHRVEVRPRSEMPDPRGESVLRAATSSGLEPLPRRVRTGAVYLIEGDLDEAELFRVATELLADPVTEQFAVQRGGSLNGSSVSHGGESRVIEVHPLPGVMDPDAGPIELAIDAMLGKPVRVRTGRRYEIEGIDEAAARGLAERCLANTVVHAIHEESYHPRRFPRASPYKLHLRSVRLKGLDDGALLRLSRESHLFLSLEEMKAIQRHFESLRRDPKEIELETLAQTWSEHCVHKTLKATIHYREERPGGGAGGSQSQHVSGAIERGAEYFRGRPGHEVHADGSVTIHNLLKSTVAAATHELIAEGVDWCLSVFVDNAGVIAFDDWWAVCFKCETHNHPSAIEPYGGAATGIGGCIRDIMGTGLAAKPIAATDVFCVAPPETEELPAGVIHPRRVLSEVVAGVRDYGNRMGIPTLNGAVWFHADYIGNPLVYCGCIGLLPRDKVRGGAKAGDRIIALGGRTGRDGIHGATFSSAELSDSHAEEFGHAVQIGNAVTQKKLLDAILEARDVEGGCLYNAITDCGAGGFSSAVGEMGEALGAEVQLDRVPLKYEGLSPTEIWISEAQERMVLAVSPQKVEALRTICRQHDVEACELGRFGTSGRELILRHHGEEIGRLSMAFLHDGLPEVTRSAVWSGPARAGAGGGAAPGMGSAGASKLSVRAALLGLLAHPNIASKRWIIRQYDHEVQGGSVIKPLVGRGGDGPSDAAVIQPVSDSQRGLGIACGLATGFASDPYVMTLCAIDECVRNLVCVGVDPSRIAILDNFCWPSCQDPRNLGELVRAAEACYDGAKAYRTPFISGKDSLNNQFTTESGRTIQIPPTLLISGMGIVEDVMGCVTMDAKGGGNWLVVVGECSETLGGSHFEMLFGATGGELPRVDLERGPVTAGRVHEAIRNGWVRSAHDVSDGGVLVAAVEMAMAGDLGLMLEPHSEGGWYSEAPSRYLLEVEASRLPDLRGLFEGLGMAVIGHFAASETVVVGGEVIATLDEVRRAWQSPLDW